MAKNKLNVEQRERSGAETFEKYDNQYHWALCKAFSLTQKRLDYVIMVEMHEDVIIGDSLDGDAVKYEFNQVKTTDGKYTIKRLTKREKNSKGILSASVMGKLLSYVKKFENPDDVISSFNLVASNGFNIKLKEERQYSDIILDDMQEDESLSLIEALKTELDLEEIPKNLHFVTSTLPEHDFQNTVLGIVTRIMDEQFNTSHGAVKVYQTLIDDLHKKGVVTFDFKDWDSLLEFKALSSVTVERVIGRFANMWEESSFQQYLGDCITELGKSASYNTALRNEVSNWLTDRTDTSSHFYLFSKCVKHHITEFLQVNEFPPLVDLSLYVWDKIEDEDRIIYKSASTPLFIAIIICEYKFHKNETGL